jgi:hypothetical protein
MIMQDVRRGEKLESAISKKELGKIAQMLAQSCPFEGVRSNNGCADCYEYKLNVTMDQKQYFFEANEMSIPDNLSPLIEYLGSFIKN